MAEHTIIVIGTSSGALTGLCELNEHLTKDLDASVFVVMHIGVGTVSPQILTQCGNLPAVRGGHENVTIAAAFTALQ